MFRWGKASLGRSRGGDQCSRRWWLEVEGEEVAQDIRRSAYLTVWADAGTGGDSGSGSKSAASSTPSSSSDEAAESSLLKIKVLSPIKMGKDSCGYDAILGAQGMAKLNLGIDKDTMWLYRKQARAFRKVVKQHQLVAVAEWWWN